MGQHMVAWGVPRSTGRIYAYLLLLTEPVSLDQIAEDLGMAKSGASTAGRHLVQFGLARSLGERGSRRLRYEALIGLDAIFAARAAQSRDLRDRLRQAAALAPDNSRRQRLAEMADSLQRLLDDGEALLRQRPGREE